MPIDRFTPKCVKVIRDRKAGCPAAAYGRVKAIRQVFAGELEDGHPGVTSNVARDVSYLKGRPRGFHTWTIEEFKRFEAHHPIGTTARLPLRYSSTPECVAPSSYAVAASTCGKVDQDQAVQGPTPECGAN